MRKLQASHNVVYRTLQAPKISGKFPTFYFSGKVTTLVMIHWHAVIAARRLCWLLCVHLRLRCICSSHWSAEDILYVTSRMSSVATGAVVWWGGEGRPFLIGVGSPQGPWCGMVGVGSGRKIREPVGPTICTGGVYVGQCFLCILFLNRTTCMYAFANILDTSTFQKLGVTKYIANPPPESQKLGGTTPSQSFHGWVCTSSNCRSDCND